MRFSALSLALNLPPLSKGGGLTERHKLLLCCFLLVIRLPFQFIKLFCRQDGGIALHPPTFSSPQPLQKDNNPLPHTMSLPPLSKGGGLTARHKLLSCCVLLATRPPFLFTKLFCRQDGGIAIQSFASHYPSRFSSGEGLCVLVWLRICIIPPTFRRVRVCVCLAGFASLQSLWAFISGILALLAPPVAPNASIPTTIAK